MCCALLVLAGCGDAGERAQEPSPSPTVTSASSGATASPTPTAPSATPSTPQTSPTSASPSPSDSGPGGPSLPTTSGRSTHPSAELGLSTGWGPTRAELDEATRRVRALSLPDLAGQVIVASYRGTTAPVRMVNDLHLGGVIVFADNISSLRQLRASNAALQSGVRRGWPVLIGVDQEGGIVARVQGGATRFPAYLSAGAADDARTTQRAGRAMADELRYLGFTMDFAPDADVTIGPSDPTIGSRSAGSWPGLVARAVVASTSGFAPSGVVPVLKHFPGHGSVTADSHTTLPVQRRSLTELRKIDFVPFAAGADHGAPSVMVAHIDVRAIDPGVPSSLSRKVVTGTLRQELGFHGLVVTDSLSMAGVTEQYNSARSAVRALRAGDDVLLMPPDPRAARNGIVAAVRDGRLTRTRVEQAAARQVALMLHTETAGSGLRPGSGAAASLALSRRAVTVATGPCQGRLVGRSVTPVGDSTAVAAFRRAAAATGLGTSGGPRIAFTGYGGGAVSADIAVATDTPYVLGRSAARVKIATYGETYGAMRALVDVLLGKTKAPGSLPVRVRGVARTGC